MARRTALSSPSSRHSLLDQVRDDLGVGLGDELVALRLELALELEVVLDDAVVDDDDPAVCSRGAGARSLRSAGRASPSGCGRGRTRRSTGRRGQDRLEVGELAGAAPDAERRRRPRRSPAES